MKYNHSYFSFCKQKILNCESFLDLLILLDLSEGEAHQLAQNKRYKTFSIKKPNGKMRLIEDPFPELKEVQGKIAFYLQTYYYFNKPVSSYGFILSPQGNKSPRNIYSNAMRHIGNAYLLNIDLKDFFHQISKEEVMAIFEYVPFQFNKLMCSWLGEIATYKERLPMGSPLSPVLTNIACMSLDEELENYCQSHYITYTRYVDDLSFSTTTQPLEKHYKSLENILHSHRFAINQQKITYYQKEQLKEITGLILKKVPEVKPEFLTEIKKDFETIKFLLEYNFDNKNVSIEKLKEQIEGKLRFVGQIHRKEDGIHKTLMKEYQKIIKTDPLWEVLSWKDAVYQI